MPADEARHGDYFEWWYWTGHLLADDGHRYGFELAFFEATPDGFFGLVSGDMAHFALTDVDGKKFVHDYRFRAAEHYVDGPGVELAIDAWTAYGADGRYRLQAAAERSSIDLQLNDVKRPVYHFGNGYVEYPKPYRGYTYYYSRPRLKVKGWVVSDGIRHAVTGQAWMDQQWGKPPETALGLPILDFAWSWYQAQLDDGRELMLFGMNVRGQPFLSAGTAIGADCSVTPLGASDFATAATGSWTSPHTGLPYPQDWTVSVAKDHLQLDITARVADQELYKHRQNPFAWLVAPSYWEGSSTVLGHDDHGPVSGSAYVEVVSPKK